MRAHTVIDSALGSLTLVAEEDAIVGLYMDLQRHRPDDGELGEPDPRGRGAEPFKAAAGQLDAYFAGELTRFDLPWRHMDPSSSNGSGLYCRTFPTARPSPTVSWPNASDRPVAPAQWAWPTGRIPSASSSRAIVSSVPMAVSPATAEAWNVRGNCSTSELAVSGAALSRSVRPCAAPSPQHRRSR
jgi:hypothetical protein